MLGLVPSAWYRVGSTGPVTHLGTQGGDGQTGVGSDDMAPSCPWHLIYSSWGVRRSQGFIDDCQSVECELRSQGKNSQPCSEGTY